MLGSLDGHLLVCNMLCRSAVSPNPLAGPQTNVYGMDYTRSNRITLIGLKTMGRSTGSNYQNLVGHGKPPVQVMEGGFDGKEVKNTILQLPLLKNLPSSLT